MRFMDLNSKEWKTCKETDYEELILQLKAGKAKREKAMNCLFEKLFYQVYEMKRDFGKLDDEAIISAYSKALLNALKEIINDKFRGESALPTWFRTIFRRRCVDAVRALSPNTNVTESQKADSPPQKKISLPENQEVPDEGGDPEANIITEEHRSEEHNSFNVLIGYVEVAMEQLTSNCKSLLHAYFEGYSMDEIAEMNQLKNAHTARQSVFRCRNKLRKALLDELADVIAQLGEGCRSLLEMYFGGTSMDKISEHYGWEEKKTRRKFSNCMAELRSIIDE